ncbi:MAG: type IV toxin-antitoxin system AbiEi family antitoxin domain-containing protein [Ilumatobacteraceae bacterium]
MPRTETYRRQLFEIAVGQYGYVTTANATAIGVPSIELPKLAEHAGFMNIAYGLYRFEDVPHSPRDKFAEAVLRVGRDAHLTGDAVLAFHELALVIPRRLRVGTNRRVRANLPEWIYVVREQLPEDELTVYDGVRSATVARALIDSRKIVMTDRLIKATHDARQQGLLTGVEVDRLLSVLGDNKRKNK